jgi:predicted transcriptional regulator
VPCVLSIPEVSECRMKTDLVITSEQVRAARALIRWEQRDLAETSKVSLPSIKRLETTPGPLAAQARTVEALRAALEAAGVEFTNGDQPGVRMRAK